MMLALMLVAGARSKQALHPMDRANFRATYKAAFKSLGLLELCKSQTQLSASTLSQLHDREAQLATIDTEAASIGLGNDIDIAKADATWGDVWRKPPIVLMCPFEHPEWNNHHFRGVDEDIRSLRQLVGELGSSR